MSEQNYQDPYAQQSTSPVVGQSQQSQYAAQPTTTDSQFSQPQQYGQMAPAAGSNYPAGGVGQDHPNATTTLILGIIGIFVPICAWIAWFLGGKAKKEISGGAPYRWGGNIKIGYYLGMIFGILAILGLILYIVAAFMGLSQAGHR